MIHMIPDSDSSGKAADTGSAVHAAAQAFHTFSQKDVEAALQAMRARGLEYPLADFQDAEDQFRAYCEDPRNARADVKLIEEKIAFEIPPHKLDTTKEAIHVVGTLDQLRVVDNRLSIYDIKTSTIDGWQLLQNHAFQIAAYSYGAELKLGEPVHPGALIRTRTYLQKTMQDGGKRVKCLPASQCPPGVFWNFAWGRKERDAMLSLLAFVVSRVRQGEVAPRPGEMCKWCFLGGVEGCLPLLLDMRSNGMISLL